MGGDAAHHSTGKASSSATSVNDADLIGLATFRGALCHLTTLQRQDAIAIEGIRFGGIARSRIKVSSN